jgi:hypothetical protein
MGVVNNFAANTVTALVEIWLKNALIHRIILGIAKGLAEFIGFFDIVVIL